MNEPTHWRIELYQRPDGSSPVVEFIEEQSVRNQAKIFAEFDDMAEFGLMPRGNKLKHLEGRRARAFNSVLYTLLIQAEN
jgi:hypothetical protein